MKTFISSFSFVVLVFISEISSAQITFQKTYGGINEEQCMSVQQTTDGGFIMAGVTTTYGAGNANLYLLKTDSNGDTLWTRAFGGSQDDDALSVQQTSDGGYIAAGSTLSYGAGNYDIYVIKTNSNGNLAWKKTYGRAGSDQAYSIQETTDGGYIIAGASASPGVGDVNIYLIKTDAFGDTLWTKLIIGPHTDWGTSVQQTSDGGYIIAGHTQIFGTTDVDVYLVKTDSNGNCLWSKIFGGVANNDLGNHVQQTADGGYIIAGSTKSFGAGWADVYLIKTDSAGNYSWSKTYGGAGDDVGWSMQQTADGGFIIGGATRIATSTLYDVYLVKTDINGDTLWTKKFGNASNGDGGNFVRQCSDGGYIIVGITVGPGIASSEVYLIKTDSSGNSGCYEESTLTTVMSPATQVTTFATIAVPSATIVTTPPTFVGRGGVITTLCTTVGISPTQSALGGEGVVIAPNPFHTSTTISLNENFSSALTFEIFNVEGKMLRQVPIVSHETIIERNGMAAGVYVYQLTDGGNVKSMGKLLVQ